MKYKEIKGKSKEELDKLMKDTKMELIKLYSQVSTGTAIKNPKQISQYKKVIAKIKTFERQQAVKIKKPMEVRNK